MKRILSWMLVLCMVLSMVPATASAATVASGTCGENLTWVLDSNGTLTISGSGEMDDYTSIGQLPWYSHLSSIVSVEIRNGVSSVGNLAFYSCENLADVSFPSTCERIGRRAFSECDLMYRISLPSGLVTIDQYAFSDCNGLLRIVIPNSVSSLGKSAFNSCQKLTSVEIGSGITLIEPYTFSYCESLETVTLSGIITAIKNNAFDQCEKLYSINLPDSITLIDQQAFRGCTDLEEITFGQNLRTIGSGAFWNCESLSIIRFTGNAPSIASNGFGNVTADAYYPGLNGTWTSDVRQNYGGALTWIADYGEPEQPEEYRMEVTPGGNRFTYEIGEYAVFTCKLNNGSGYVTNWDCPDWALSYSPPCPFAYKGWQTKPDGSYILTFEATSAGSANLVISDAVSGDKVIKTLEVIAPTDDEPGSSTEPDTSSVIRLSGKNRYETAFAVANQLKRNLEVNKFSAVVVAYGQNFPDALTGSYLAAVKNAPILLTEANVDADVLTYLRENLISGGRVYILGGTAAVSQAFEDGAKKLGFSVKRLKGAGRYETNLAILAEAGVSSNDEVLIATGTNYADSLSASATGLPILLVDQKLTESQKDFLKGTSKKFVILGGTGAVSAKVESQLDAIGTVERVKGANRFITSVTIAERYFRNPNSVVLAYGKGFPDGLCGGPLALSMGVPLILTSYSNRTVADNYVVGISSGAVCGGTGKLSDFTVRDIFDLPDDAQIVIP